MDGSMSFARTGHKPDAWLQRGLLSVDGGYDSVYTFLRKIPYRPGGCRCFGGHVWNRRIPCHLALPVASGRMVDCRLRAVAEDDFGGHHLRACGPATGLFEDGM